MGRAVLAIAMAIAALVASTPARADAVQFIGPHALAPDIGDGMCFIEGPHWHSYEPHEPDVLYVQRDDDAYVFVGDPVVFEPEEAPHYAYYGHHPVTWAVTGDKVHHYCYISGPHHHWYRPVQIQASVEFDRRGGAYWYVGAHPRWYRRRVRRHAHVDAWYAGVELHRPEIIVTPPVGFVGFYVVGKWSRDEVVWHEPGRKRPGPPPWAPAWGRRGHGKVHFKGHGPKGKVHFKTKGGKGKVHFKSHGSKGKVHFKSHGPKGKVHFKSKGGKGKVHFKSKGGRGQGKTRGGGRGRGRGRGR